MCSAVRVLVLMVLLSTCYAQTTTYSGTECANVFSSTQVLSTPRITEPNLQRLNRLLTSSFDSTCRIALKDIGCNAAFATSPPASSLWSTASNACGSSLCGRAPCYNSYDALVSAYTGGTVSSSQTGSATGSGADDLLECPDPLLKYNDNIAQDLAGTAAAGSACSYPCYYPVYSDDEMDDHIKLLDAFAWISFTLSVLLIGFNLLEVPDPQGEHGEKEAEVIWFRPWLEYPERLRLNFTLCIGAVSLCLTFGTFIGDDKKLWCDIDYRDTCRAQGSLLEFFGLASALWWLCIGLNTYLTVVREWSVEPTEALEKWYHVVSWGVPAIASFLVLLPADKIGFPGYGSMWCWIVSDSDAVWQFVFFYTEVGICALTGTYLFIHIVYKIYTRHELTIKETLSSMGPLLAFILMYVLLFSWMFGYRVDLQANKDTYKDSFQTYFECLVTNWASSANPQVSYDSEGCSVSDKPSVGLWYFQTINLAGLGTFTFFVFGIHGAVGYFRSWRYYKSLSCCGEKETEVDKRGVRLEANYHNDQHANQDGATLPGERPEPNGALKQPENVPQPI